MTIQIPKLSLVVLIGPSGSGKTTFAHKHFLPSEVISSDYCRGLVSDDENNQAATDDAFDVLNYIAGKRLARGRLTVIDATNVGDNRSAFVQLARKYHCLPVAIVLDMPESVCLARNKLRPDRTFGVHVIRKQRMQLRQSLKKLQREGFRHVFVLRSPAEVDAATIERVPLWNDRTDELGPFDIIGDVHGCADELEELLGRLGYETWPIEHPSSALMPGPFYYGHPQGRKAVFVGDLVDRGPRNLDVVRLVNTMIQHNSAICVPGNHDMKLLRKLNGREVQVAHGLAQTLAEIDALPDSTRGQFCVELAKFLDSLVSHYVLDNGRLVVAHAGLKEEMHGRGSGGVREFALYGDTTGERDEYGLPIRLNWAAEYRGAAMVVYGHTPVSQPQWLNQTVNIDTGCVFGGKLTALRYPEREFLSVDARQTYCETRRPFLNAPHMSALSAQQANDDLLDVDDVIGKRLVSTRLHGNVTIGQEHATAALEVMSRFAVDPKWMIYLPPTMSPCATSQEPGLLEHPAEAFAYFRDSGVSKVVCEEKHMGSRAIVVVCRDSDTAEKRFGVINGSTQTDFGAIYTRSGRPFFSEASLQLQFLNRIRDTISAVNYWDQFQTDWFCLDCELMPWSSKAQELIRSQYAAVGAAGRTALPAAAEALRKATSRLTGQAQQACNAVMGDYEQRGQSINRFVDAYRQYCWSVDSVDDYKLAPFHLLASEGKCHHDRDHVWHMETLSAICAGDPNWMLATNYRVVDLADPASEEAATDWWLELTQRGGEGMVVKPFNFVVRDKKSLVQPAVKCRGPEYLRIIYGPDYRDDKNLSRLRSRGLGLKRSLALREFSLGIEGLERFVRREPLRRVHECVFGVLALESQPVDPRL
jgi:protein phosphatase